MSQLTDANIVIQCSDCTETAQGLQAMFEHIIYTHPRYSAYEAETYAEKWMQNAYEREELRERAASND